MRGMPVTCPCATFRLRASRPSTPARRTHLGIVVDDLPPASELAQHADVAGHDQVGHVAHAADLAQGVGAQRRHDEARCHEV